MSNKALTNANVHPPAPNLNSNRQLWHNYNFTIFWFGQTLSELGNSFSFIVFPLLVLQATNSVVQMGLVTAVMGVSRTITGLIAGWLADHIDRRRLMIFCDTLRLLCYASIPLVWWLVGPQIWLVYAVVALGAGLGMVFQVTFGTAVANLVTYDQLAPANGYIQTTFALAQMLGPILAGILSGLFNPSIAIAFDALSFAISAISLYLIRLRTSPDKTRTSSTSIGAATQDSATSKRLSVQRFWPEFLAGASFIWNTPILRALVTLIFLINLLIASIDDLLIYYIKHNLQQTDTLVGIVMGCSFIGGMVAGLVAPYLRKKLGFGPCWIGGYALYFFALLLISTTGNLLLIGVLASVLTLTMTTTAICSISLRQQIAPDRLLGRVTSAFLMIVTAFAPVGAALSTTLAAHFGATLTLGGMSIGGLLIAGVAIFTPIRQRHPEHPDTNNQKR